MQDLGTIKAQNQLRLGQIADTLRDALVESIDYIPDELAVTADNALALYSEFKELNPVT